MKQEMQNLIVNISSNMNNIFREEEDAEPYIPVDLNTVDANDLFTAELLSLLFQFIKLTGNDVDLLDFIAVLNKLAFQYIQDCDKEDEE